MRTPDDVQIALLAYLKTQTSLLTLLGDATQIKEAQWQGADFIYPAIRLTNVVKPSLDGCSPDNVDISIFVMSEKKSSRQCGDISAEVANVLHRKQFVSNEMTLSSPLKVTKIWVTEIPYPSQQEDSSIWIAEVKLSALVN